MVGTWRGVRYVELARALFVQHVRAFAHGIVLLVVEANIRGGGEFGPSWHQAALKENRCKSYEDFIAVGEHLVASEICTPQTLAARGGSNVRVLIVVFCQMWLVTHASSCRVDC